MNKKSGKWGKKARANKLADKRVCATLAEMWLKRFVFVPNFYFCNKHIVTKRAASTQSPKL